MKIKTEKEPLLKAVQILQNTVSAKATLPNLSNFLIETQKNKISQLEERLTKIEKLLMSK